ncbi:1-phosphofructokinase family hexose kinase [Brevibacterium marinum]|uniref:1-phosphofructokinase family hexose kinase n=1 Tax=Brevibacterium marinum TaxID=418643 RepID=A0A846RV48_9MICO|nr:PfkB family carbohydrate kinase [Brevibacterium marinum]NJC55846.1 1-phosphofructokinase family hexose kinase [Brevibacterium marinum]
MTGGDTSRVGAVVDTARVDTVRDTADDPHERPAPDVITVTLSPARDITISTQHLDPGRSHRIDPAAGRLGGKGINVARVLASIGTAAYVQGPVSREHWPESDGRRCADSSTDIEPVWDLTPSSTRLRCSYAVVEESGRATVLNERAPAQTPTVWTALTETIMRRLRETSVSVLVISGSTPADCPDDFHAGLVGAAHAAGVSVIVDTSGPALLTAARAGADWVKPNDEELKELFAHEDATTSARELVGLGAHRVLVSRGEAGMVLVDGNGTRWSARLRRVLRGNPTGAGDAAVAALAHHLVESPDSGWMSEGSVRDMVALSASAVLMPQAGRIHPDWKNLRTDVSLERA